MNEAPRQDSNSSKGGSKSTSWCETVFSHHGWMNIIAPHVAKGPTGPTTKN